MYNLNSNMKNADVLSRRQDEIVEELRRFDKEHFNPLEIEKDERYLSNYESNLILLDVSNNSKATVKMEVDLDKIMIDCAGEMSVFHGVYPLKIFPNLLSTCKVYLNICIKTFGNSSKAKSDVRQNFNNLIKFMSWMIKRKGVYKFSDLSENDFRDFIADFTHKGGWSGVHEYERSFQRIIEKIKTNEYSLDDWFIRQGSAKIITLRESHLQRIIGLPIYGGDVPVWFYDELVKLAGVGFYHKRNSKVSDGKLSQMKLYNVFKAINRVYGLPIKFDQVQFLPIPNSDKLSHFLATKASEGRTKNLSLDDAYALFSEASKWIYDYSPFILPMLKVIRKKIENNEPLRSSDKEVKALMKALIFNADLPFSEITLTSQCLGHKKGKAPCLVELVESMMTACFVMVAINHGRRLNEIIGSSNLPFGLYFGCIKTPSAFNALRKIDIYIEKTVKDWSDFYVNKLVEDSVSLLEGLSQIFRPLHTEEKMYEPNINKAREDKLFVMRRFSENGFSTKAFGYSYNKHGKLFLHLANVSEDCFDFRTHPFRRLFALLYYYRYDNPKLLALQHHLRHLDPGMTNIYVTDPIMRADADRIEVLYQDRIREYNQEEMGKMEDIRSEAFYDAIYNLLKGERTGGKWPSIVIPLYNQLSKTGEFDGLSLSEASSRLSKKLEGSGYSRISFKHGGCNVGDNFRTKKMSGCFNEDDCLIHHENASPLTCYNCPHFDQGEANLDLLSKELLDLRKESVNENLPPAVRKAIVDESKCLEQVLNAEKKLMKDNQKAIHGMVKSFALMVDEKGEL